MSMSYSKKDKSAAEAALSSYMKKWAQKLKLVSSILNIADKKLTAL